MKQALPFVWLLFFAPLTGLKAQYYLTGTTFADSAKPAPFTKIFLHSKKLQFQSGSKGDFGIPSAFKTDTISCWKEGYDTSVHIVTHGQYNPVLLKPNAETIRKAKERGRLLNLVPEMTKYEEPYIRTEGETYPTLAENQWVTTAQHPAIGISPNSNRAAYANIRRFINNGNVVNPQAVRLEEVINYFSVSFAPTPKESEVFSMASQVTDCPWNKAAKLLFINAKTREIPQSAIPPANLVFLIDNSGSMNDPNRMPLLKSAFGMLVKSLRDADKVAIVTYGGAAGIYLPPTSGADKKIILQAIDSLEAGGATSGGGGIRLAYDLAVANMIPGGNNRVIMATDGDFNVGAVTEKELEELIIRYRASGINLTCLGLGMGNFKDSKIETLARHGNGNYAYLDSEEEAEKVMVKEFNQNLFSVAEDVTLKAHFNPAVVAGYRLVGYQNRKDAWYSNKAVLVGGEIGPGTPVNVVFEVVPADTSGAIFSKEKGEKIGTVVLEYTGVANGKGGVTRIEFPLVQNYLPLEQAGNQFGFVTALILYGNYLKNPAANQQNGFDRIKELAVRYADTASPLQTGFIDLVEKTRKLYQPPQPETKSKSSPFRKKRL